MNITNPLRIGYEICALLQGSEILAEHVRGRIYAYTSKAEAKLPCIIYEGISVDFEETKDGAEANEVSIQLLVNTSDYPTGIAISEEVVDVLSEHAGIVPISASCDYDVAAMMFTHTLTFKVYIQ